MAREMTPEKHRKMMEASAASLKRHREEMVSYFKTVYEAPDPIELLMQIE